jgi:hypothetical protein
MEPDGPGILKLRLNGKQCRAEIAPGMEWHRAVLASSYFEPAKSHPLTDVAPLGNA